MTNQTLQSYIKNKKTRNLNIIANIP